MQIEQPKKKGAPPRAEGYATIGQFYEAIEDAIIAFCKGGGERWLFSGDPGRQIQPDTFYYGGGGNVVVVHDLESAKRAIEEIVEQGEGVDGEIFDGDKPGYFGQGEEYAHYFRFKEVRYERFYSPKQNPKGDPPPRGKPLPVDWNKVYPMQTDPKASDYEPGSALWEKSAAFNKAYTSLLHTLHQAFNGTPDKLLDAVGKMYQLQDLAKALMRTPVGDSGQNAGPTFEYWPPPVDSKVITIPEFQPIGHTGKSN